MGKRAVLYADDDPTSAVTVREALAPVAAVETCDSVAAAVTTLSKRSVDCVVTEYDLPDGTALDLAKGVEKRAPGTPCVLFTDVDPGDFVAGGPPGVVLDYLPRDGPGAEDRLARFVRSVS